MKKRNNPKSIDDLDWVNPSPEELYELEILPKKTSLQVGTDEWKEYVITAILGMEINNRWNKKFENIMEHNVPDETESIYLDMLGIKHVPVFHPDEGYVRKNYLMSLGIPSTTLQQWENRNKDGLHKSGKKKKRHPHTGELLYPIEWIIERIRTYKARSKTYINIEVMK